MKFYHKVHGECTKFHKGFLMLFLNPWSKKKWIILIFYNLLIFEPHRYIDHIDFLYLNKLYLLKLNDEVLPQSTWRRHRVSHRFS